MTLNYGGYEPTLWRVKKNESNKRTTKKHK